MRKQSGNHDPHVSTTIEQEVEDYCIIDSPSDHESLEPIRDRIERVRQDLNTLTIFYTISTSPERSARLSKYFNEELTALSKAPFEAYDQEQKTDYLLLRNFLERGLRKLRLDASKDKKTEVLLPFAGTITRLWQERQRVEVLNSQKAAQDMYDVSKQINERKEAIRAESVKIDKTSAFRAAKIVDELARHLEEWFAFFNGYDPLFTWWVAEPYAKAKEELQGYSAMIRETLVGIKPGGEESAIIGDPVGREGLLDDLRAEMIPYTPEEVLQIGEKEYAWCEAEMKKASRELGYGEDWRKALEYVKTLYVEPGQQTQLVKKLSTEATEYVKKHDLITVPALAEEAIPMHMMSPARQMVNPFFLGGDEIIVSYPTNTMAHEAKLMSMRGNNIHFSRSTVFHELIPGHHLQMFMTARHATHRNLFWTPFSIEGWAFYWELILWDDARFAKTAENRIGMLFWRMHRCCRILFSLNFHLGRMTPRACVDLLVRKGGHERATAEGEVRRSFAGEYAPLYQAAYMLGALQFYSLRKEVVGGGLLPEKEFHDRVMREGQMPVELLRALLKGDALAPDYGTSWRFYPGLET